MFKHFARRPARRLAFAVLTLVAIIGRVQIPLWSAGVTDIIWLESNSTAGNSILTFKNDGSGNPIFLIAEEETFTFTHSAGA